MANRKTRVITEPIEKVYYKKTRDDSNKDRMLYERILKHYPGLLKEFEIKSAEYFVEKLVAPYYSRLRDTLDSKLSPKDREAVKKCYYRNVCKSPKNQLECLKVKLIWEKSVAFVLNNNKHLMTFTAEYDRATTLAKYCWKAEDGTKMNLVTPLDGTFCKDVFVDANHCRRYKELGPIAIDANWLSAELSYSDGQVYKYWGSCIPDNPYYDLYKCALRHYEDIMMDYTIR